jgi:hypothetical protein
MASKGCTDRERAILAEVEELVDEGVLEVVTATHNEALAKQPLTQSEARRVTDQVKRDAEHLWQRLVLLYEGGAHIALGYTSWGDYFEAEFGGKKSHAYRLLESGRVLEVVRDSPTGERPANEAQARELAPLLDQPERLQEAWSEARNLHGNPTAADVRDVVQGMTGVRQSPAPAAEINAIAKYIRRKLDAIDVGRVPEHVRLSLARLLREEADRLDPPPPPSLWGQQP